MKGAAAWLLIRIACGAAACIISVVAPFDSKAACRDRVALYDRHSDFCLTGSCGCQPGLSEAALKGVAVMF